MSERPEPWAIVYEDAQAQTEAFLTEVDARRAYEQRIVTWDCYLLAPEAELARLRRIETAAQVFLDAAEIYDKTAWSSTPPDDRYRVASAYTEARDALESALNEQSEGERDESWRLVERYCVNFATDDFRLVFQRVDQVIEIGVGKREYDMFNEQSEVA